MTAPALTLRPMTDAELARWYENELSEAFAPQERKPLSDIRGLRAEGRYEPLGLFAPDGSMPGYAALWTAPETDVTLLDYLGVSAALRNAGLGARLLALLGARQRGRPLIAESELPVPGGDAAENSLRARRVGFYRRNGFAPVYEMATCGLRWQALLLGDAPEPGSAAMDALMAGHRALYGPARTDVKIPLGPDETPSPPYWMR